MDSATTSFLHLLIGHFGWNLARAKCLTHLILAFIKVRTVNFTQLAVALPGQTLTESKYKRIQRLFRELTIDFSLVALFIAHQLPEGTYRLVMDRTNWKFGKRNINILFLAIVHQGIAIPIFWTLLNKKGNSNTRERIQLIDRFIQQFGVEKIESYLADREFIGEAFIKYLIDNKIKFRIRIRNNTRLSRIRNGSAPVRNFFRNLPRGTYQQLLGQRTIWNHRLFVTGGRLPSGEFLIIITPDASSAEAILNDYKQRWEVETLFKALKTQGFNLEETHLQDLDRIEKLIALLTISFVWAHLMGEWLHEQKPIPLKSHQRPAISIFRYGLDHLRGILLNFSERLQEFYDAVALFRSTKSLINSLI